MTSIESRSYCRVVVIAPSTRVDLALPADVPITDLLPMLLQYAGETRDDGGGAHGGWKLLRVDHGEMDGGRTLRSLDVNDGEVLRLTPREERTVVPVFDDIVDAIATTSRERLSNRSVNPWLGAAVVVGALLAGAFTLYQSRLHATDAYIAGGICLAVLGLGTATAKGAGDRVMATATAASGVPFAVICGLNAVTGHAYGVWGLLLGSSIALVYSLVAVLSLETGTVVFAATATISLLTSLSALVAGLADVTYNRVIAGTVAVALAALSILPRLAVRLARLPLATVPTTGEDLAATDDVGDIENVTARARLAGEYLTGTQIGCAITIGVCAAVLGSARTTALSIALAAVVTVAMALRARSVASLSGRIALIGSAALAGVLPVVIEADKHGFDRDAYLLIAELALGLFALIVATARSRRRVSPATMRLIDFLESGAVIAVLPIAVGVMGLYSALRHL